MSLKDTKKSPAPKPKVVLVLQGGGALGAYHIGAYQALEEAGFRPDWVSGISIGAINAAILVGNEPDRRLARLEELWHAISRSEGWTLPLTGAFWMVFWLPYEMQKAALWIPSVHIFELIRDGHFGTSVPTHYDIGYVLTWIAVLNLLGMAAIRRARRDIVL